MIQDAPMALPGKCGICGASRERQFLDLNLSFEFYGALIFCEDCVAEIARQFGWCKPGELAAAKQEIDAKETELITLRSRLAATEAYIAAVFSSDPASGALFGSSSISEPVSMGNQEPATTDSGEGPTDSESNESVSEPRSNDLRDRNIPRFSASLEL